MTASRAVVSFTNEVASLGSTHRVANLEEAPCSRAEAVGATPEEEVRHDTTLLRGSDRIVCHSKHKNYTMRVSETGMPKKSGK